MSMLAFDTPIESRADFALFLRALADDYSKNSSNWEPQDIADLLDRMAFFAGEPLTGFTANMRPGENPDEASWRTFADILAGARIYE